MITRRARCGRRPAPRRRYTTRRSLERITLSELGRSMPAPSGAERMTCEPDSSQAVMVGRCSGLSSKNKRNNSMCNVAAGRATRMRKIDCAAETPGRAGTGTKVTDSTHAGAFCGVESPGVFCRRSSHALCKGMRLPLVSRTSGISRCYRVLTASDRCRDDEKGHRERASEHRGRETTLVRSHL